jgi:hypothetical protein
MLSWSAAGGRRRVAGINVFIIHCSFEAIIEEVLIVQWSLGNISSHT